MVFLSERELVELSEVTAGGAVQAIARCGADAAIRTYRSQGRREQKRHREDTRRKWEPHLEGYCTPENKRKETLITSQRSFSILFAIAFEFTPVFI